MATRKVPAHRASPDHPANQPLDPTQKDVLHRAFALTRSSKTDDTEMDSLPETQGEASEFIRRSYARHFGIGAKKTPKPAKKTAASKKKGTYVSIEPFHLFRYLDEQAFRFNERKDTDRGRFFKALAGITGKRLTWVKLTGEGDGLPANI